MYPLKTNPLPWCLLKYSYNFALEVYFTNFAFF